jgi:hypothetical protein
MKMPLFFLGIVAASEIFASVGCRSRESFPPGGCPYPERVSAEDTGFYLYPLREKLSKRDSFSHIWDNYEFQDLDEPNLSLRPLKTTEFRFFQPGYRHWDDLVILLTPTTLTVKRQSANHSRFTTDTNRRSQLENSLQRFMRRHYGRPRPDSLERPVWYHFIDSMEKRYPQLKDPSYYVKLVEKSLIPDTAFRPCRSSTRQITTGEYRSFVDSLNASGYWQMPYKRECDADLAIDGPYYFSLEANTPRQYQFVNGNPCPNDTNLFYKACQHLVRLAGLEKEINVLWVEGPPDTSHHSKPLVVDDVQLEDIKLVPKKHHSRKHSK